MNYIKIEEQEKGINVQINGEAGKLVEIIASSIINDPNLGVLILAALAAIADHQSNPLNNINPN